ncbi:MAG TPA: phosphoglucosamine mutase [Thermoleophilaceae bacterium]|nr:phosphoglucosamine mutase [Thermoleophilaceae bacterium]
MASDAVTSRRLFGTDGVRGRAGEFLTADLALRLGHAAVGVTQSSAPQVLIVRDTRESGQMFEAALAAGITAAGGDAVFGGVLPTPGAAVLARRLGFDLAAVVSASHNPYHDNGIKFFGSDGTKLDDDMEARIEQAVLSAEEPATMAERAGRTRALRGAQDDYLRELELRFKDLDLSGKRILLDCANGAAYHVGPEIFRRLGADVDVVADQPDGRNINAACGSTHIEGLAETMTRGSYDAGFAFDGDADRVLAVDREGEVIDGDEIIAIAALHLHARGDLPGPGVAVTVMTNFGFHNAMKAAGIEVVTTPVGDRNVIVALLGRGWALGGEQSGHIIETRFVPSGDGVAAALLTLEAMGGRDLAERDAMEKLPQVLLNVRVGDREAIEGAREVWDAVDRESQALAGQGRVLVRASGTEPLVRVMVEAPEKAQCAEIAGRLAETVERELA